MIEYLSGIGQAELLSVLKKADISVAEENLYGVYSYFQENDLIISIRVPHVLGDHTEFRMGLQ